MAYLKTGGGYSGVGIKEYFENGKKQGRELHRDEIDQRIFLEGDLDLCAKIIDSRETKEKTTERYDHVTLSFKEKDISPETMRAIVADFKNFIGSAYTEDEIYLYAEAHMPKTATEEKWNPVKKQYETVERYPHIHFIIPKTNLLTGERLSVFEKIDLKFNGKYKTSDFTDAFQESINEKYGLESPKDNRRDAFESKADIISAIKEDEFSGKNRESLKMIRDLMIDRKIESVEAFKEMLTELGEVSEGKGGEYLQIKLHGEKKNIRLKDYQFSAEFISKPIQEKLDFYTIEGKDRSPKQKADDLAKGAVLLQKWHDRAREIKYLHTDNPFYKNTYSKASDKEKTELLNGLEAAYYEKLQEKHGYHNAKLAAERGPDQPELSPEVQAEIKEQIDAIRIEEFSSSRLNNTYLRTIEELRNADEAGQKIIEAPGEAIDALTFSQSHFSELALERHLLKNTSGPEQYEAAMRAIMACPELVINDDDEKGIQFTSKKIVAIEKNLADRAERMAGTVGVAVSAQEQQSIIAATPFNQGQREGFELLCSGKQLTVVNGAAGTGKSFILAEMRKAYEKEGFTVYGAILQGKTAEDLQRDSGIKSATIARTLLDLESGKLQLNTKSVLVVDEAGMVGSRDLEKLMAHTEAAGARLRLVGDAKQLAAVEYGNAFVEVSARAQVARLTEIMRQKTEWQRQASEKFSVHDIQGLQDYADHGHVHLEDTARDAQIELVKAWSQHRAEQPEQTRIVLAHANADRIQLNEIVRAELKKQGELQNEILVDTPRGKVAMAEGEQIMFTKADKNLGVKNGTTGVIQKISAEGVVTVALESGKTCQFDAVQTGDSTTAVDLGWAVTVHKSQGMTVDAAFVFANKSMTKENLGVAMTRHRHQAQVFGSKEQFANIPEMVKTLDRSGEKAFTGDKGWSDTHRREDSVIGQYVAELTAAKVIEKAAKSAEFKEIAANLDPQRVLDYVSKSHHQIDASKYSIVTNDAGQKLIQSGERTMSAATFLTKTLHLDYQKEAALILKQCYAEQLAKAYSIPRHAPGQGIDQTLKNEFADHRKTRDADLKKEAEAIDEKRREAKAAIDKSDAPKAAKDAAKAAIDEQTKAQKLELQAKKEQRTADTYKDFLAAKAPASARHLDELARVSFTPADHARMKSIQVAQGIVPGLDRLTPAQLEKGISHVLNLTDPNRPPAAIIERNQRAAAERNRLADDLARSAERTPAPQADQARGVPELPAGGVDAEGLGAGVLLPNPVSGGVADNGTRQHNDVRRARASAGSSTERVLTPGPGATQPIQQTREAVAPATPPAPARPTLTTADLAAQAQAQKKAAREAKREAEAQAAREAAQKETLDAGHQNLDPSRIDAPAPQAPDAEPEAQAAAETALSDADRNLIARIDDAIERAAQGDQKAMDSLPGLLDKLDDAQRDAASAYGRAKPKQFDWPAAEREAQRAREETAKLQVNGQAAARAVGAVPYPEGKTGHWAIEHHSSYETALKKAVAEAVHHAREPRPEGFWKKQEATAYDVKAADLQIKVTGWEKEIKWRDGALQTASAALAQRDEAHVAALKAEYDRQQIPTAEKAEPLRERSEAHTRENSRLQEKIERLFDKEKRQELDQKQRDDFGI